MQEIDFYLALLESGNVIIIVLFSSLAIYASRIKEIFSDIGVETRYALIAYGFSGIAMAVATFVSVNEGLRYFVTGAGAFFLGAIVAAQLWVLVPGNRAKQGTIAIVIMVVGVFINNYLEEFYGYPLYIMMVVLTLLIIASFYFAIVLLRENPSTFTASLFIVLVLYMLTWIIGMTGWTFTNPLFFIVQIIPLIFAATIFSSVRRPWRFQLAAFIMLFTISLCLPILTTSYNAGSFTIFTFVAIEAFTAICLISPLNYFLDQAAETGAKTPLYLGGVVAFIALLLSTHSLSWSAFISNGLVWNNYIVWIDVIIGVCAITAFILAAVSSLYGDWATMISREALVIFGTGAVFMTFPLTQPAWVTNDQVWLVLGAVIIIGTLLFVRLSYRIYKAGAGAAARNLMLFVISAIMIAIVSMYSDNIPPLPPAIPWTVIFLLLIADVMSLVSNPNFVTEAKRRFRREKSQSAT